MKYFSRFASFTLSAAALAAAIGSAQASDWFSFNLFGSQPDTASQPAAVSPAQADATVTLAAAKLRFKDGSFTGPSFDAYYGLVQVQANVQAGRLISIDVLQSPNHRGTSRAINRQALPMLEREVVRAQGVRVNIISGATLTSQAYLRSLSAALKQAAS